MFKFLSWSFNGLTIGAIVMIACGSLIWPAPHLAADTTGLDPDLEIIGNDFLSNDVDIEFYSIEDVTCLTENMYHEARSDGFAGMYATTMVVLNRVNDYRYPDTICDVVKQGPVKESWTTAQHKDILELDRIYFPIKNKCQFSWYCDGKADTMYDEDSLRIATEIAYLVLGTYELENIVDITEGSTHYHATSVSPYWISGRGMAKITQIGSHIFYRWN
jgi:spore germination cell wall hydrolase CwlJ-like protein